LVNKAAPGVHQGIFKSNILKTAELVAQFGRVSSLQVGFRSLRGSLVAFR
jgi:hypothetical protein